MEIINVYQSTDVEALRKNLKKLGWLSAHYLTRHGHNVNLLRKQAKAGQIQALQVHNFGTTTWYYKKEEVERSEASEEPGREGVISNE